MHPHVTTDLVLSTETSATAYKRATKVLWLDIIVTITILAAVASFF